MKPDPKDMPIGNMMGEIMRKKVNTKPVPPQKKDQPIAPPRKEDFFRG